MNTVAGYPLFHALAEVTDFRQSRGKRHELAAILALSCAAALCGASGLTAISQWGRDHSREVLARQGARTFRGRVPPRCVGSSASWTSPPWKKP